MKKTETDKFREIWIFQELHHCPKGAAVKGRWSKNHTAPRPSFQPSCLLATWKNCFQCLPNTLVETVEMTASMHVEEKSWPGDGGWGWKILSMSSHIILLPRQFVQYSEEHELVKELAGVLCCSVTSTQTFPVTHPALALIYCFPKWQSSYPVDSFSREEWENVSKACCKGHTIRQMGYKLPNLFKICLQAGDSRGCPLSPPILALFTCTGPITIPLLPPWDHWRSYLYFGWLGEASWGNPAAQTRPTLFTPTVASRCFLQSPG